MDLTKEYNDINLIVKQLNNIIYDKKNLDIDVDTKQSKLLLNELSNKIAIFEKIMSHIKDVTCNFAFDYFDKDITIDYKTRIDKKLLHCCMRNGWDKTKDLQNTTLRTILRQANVGKKTAQLFESFLILHNIKYTE